ncbi:MAG: tetratricopeptide repeat protein [Acidobacteriota bacterium]
MNYLKKIALFSSILLLIFGSSLLNSQRIPSLPENIMENLVVFSAFDDNGRAISSGTGFLIAKEVLVTNYHLVSKAVDKVEGINYKGKKVKLEGIYSLDKNYDLAVIKVNRKEDGLPCGNFSELEAGKKIVVAGANISGELEVSEGEVVEIIEVTPSLRVAELSLQVPLTCSGAPVMNSEGKVLGVLNILEGERKVAIPIDPVLNMRKSGKKTEFKKRQPEDYFTSLEGALFAGRIFAALGESGRAQMHLENAVKQSPDDVDLLLLLASVYTDQRNYSSAANTYKKIVEKEPQRDDVYFKMGNVYLNMMKWKEAIPPLEKAIELNTDNAKSYFHIGRAYEELRQFDKSIEAYQKYLDLNPEDAGEAWRRLGFCLFENKEFEKAAPAFEEALKTFSQEIRLHERLAQAYQEAKIYEKAENKYYELAELNPERAATYYNSVIQMYDQAKMPENAINAAKKMVEANPESHTARYNLGYMYIQLESWQDAINVFKQVIEIRPDYDYAYYNLGYCYTQIKNYREAVNPFKKFAELNPNDPNGWFNIGVCYMQMKNFQAALEPLQKTVELKPDYGLALYNLAVTYLNLQDRNSAIDIYEKLKTIDSNLAQRLLEILSR